MQDRLPVGDDFNNSDPNDLNRKQIIYTAPNESIEIVWDSHTEQGF